MAKLLKLRRGTTTQHSSFTGAEGEVTVDTDKETLVVHDGSTAGGHPVAAEDLANVSSTTIANRLSNDSLATSKLAAGALPSDVTVQSANIVNGTIVGADIANDTITATQLAAGAADVNVLLNGAVTTAKIANDAVTGAKIAAEIDNSHITASAAIAGTKISPDFGSQTITTTGNLNTADITITDPSPSITFTDNDQNPDYKLVANSGQLKIYDVTNSSDRFVVNTDGHIDVKGNLDCESGIDVTGNVVASGEVEAGSLDINGSISPVQIDHTGGSGISINRSGKSLTFNANYGAANSHSTLDTNCTDLRLATGGADRLAVNSSGASVTGTLTASNVYASGNLGLDSGDCFTFVNNTKADLYINGSNEFRFEADGDFHADGDVIAQSTTTASDRRLKENIEVIPNALDKVQALNGVSFDWKKTGEKSAGVIAQEVQGVLPEAVKEVTPVGGGDSHLTVNYHALTSILIEAIKQLKAELDEHKGGK